MGLKDAKENKIKKETARIVWENENRTLSKIADMAEKEEKTGTTTFEQIRSVAGAQESRIGVNGKTVKKAKIKNKEEETVEVYISDEKDVMVLSKSIDSETRVGITKDNDGTIIYTLISPETGKIDLARVSPSNLAVYNYGTKMDESVYGLSREYPRTTDISGDKVEGNTLREIVSSHIQEHGIMGQYSERIMSAFDSILSLDEERDITPLSEEQISRIEFLREAEAMKGEIGRSEGENSKLTKEVSDSKESYKQMQEQLLVAEKEIERLTQKLSKSEEQLESSEATNKRLSEIIRRIKERVSKIPFFGKKALRDIGVTEQQLPAAPNNSSNDFKEKYEVNPASLNRESDRSHDSQTKSKEDNEIGE